MRLIRKSVTTPVGALTLIANDQALVTLLLPQGPSSRSKLTAAAVPGDNAVLQQAELQLDEYFAGCRTVFEVPLAPAGTAFQATVWAALATIPYGVTKSYGDIARAIGAPRAVRAVGSANGRNPVPIFIPCHRVIGADGTLTGFGGGLELKSYLLSLEGHARPSQRAALAGFGLAVGS